MTAIGDTMKCPRCGREYLYHGLIVCDPCHARGNRIAERQEAQARREAEHMRRNTESAERAWAERPDPAPQQLRRRGWLGEEGQA